MSFMHGYLAERLCVLGKKCSTDVIKHAMVILDSAERDVNNWSISSGNVFVYFIILRASFRIQV